MLTPEAAIPLAAQKPATNASTQALNLQPDSHRGRVHPSGSNAICWRARRPKLDAEFKPCKAVGLAGRVNPDGSAHFSN
jgi:hypothetical protein